MSVETLPSSVQDSLEAQSILSAGLSSQKDEEIARLKEALLVKNQFLNDILNTSSTISIISTDLEQNIIHWNSGAQHLLGFTEEEMVRKQKIALIYGGDTTSISTMRKARDFIMEHRTGITCDVAEVTRDGKKVWMKVNLTPRFDETGKIIGMLGVGQDITEHKQTEKMLHHSLQKVRRAMSGTIHAMAMTVEIRDPYTAGHQRRATDLARAIGEQMKLPKDQVDGLRMAGVIHDLGKVSIPAEILNKPGKLTKNEFALIKCHPETGFDIIKYIEFPWPIAQIVLQHHERYNGEGYPRGLKGNKICIEARIIAVADVVESMSSHRPYRPALGLDEALGEIVKGRGTFYDPDVVDACLCLFNEKGYVLISGHGPEAFG